MESQVGESSSIVVSRSLQRKLNDSPYDFSFFQVVRLLQFIGTRLPVGYFTEPANEAVRFGGFPSLAFPPAELRGLDFDFDAPPRLTTHFFGLIGPAGVLPTFYTAFLIERILSKDYTFSDFLDIFQHRLTSLFYRVWEKYHFAIAYERRQEDSLSGHLLDLIGIGTAGLRNRQEVADQALMGYVGLLGQTPRSQSAFCQLLRDYFNVPVEVIAFAGTWRKIERSAWTRLDESRNASGQLGLGTVLGDEVWDEQSVVKVRLGPLSLAQYKQFLPDGNAFRPLQALQRFFCGDDYDVEVQLVLRREDAPRCGLDADAAEPPRLGWISWMFSAPLDRDPDETVLRLWDL
jgi:type VI secretion system protein ImpH